MTIRHILSKRFVAVGAVSFLLLPRTVAHAKPPAARDDGPVITVSVKSPKAPDKSKGKNQTPDVLAVKGINIRLGNGASVCFDTDLLRYAAGWTGGFLDLSKTNMAIVRGEAAATVEGSIKFVTQSGPGYGLGHRFIDPRADRQGPLPTTWGRYRGLYRCGEQTVLSYTVAGAGVLDLPGAVAADGLTGFTRTLQLEKTDEPRSFCICDTPAGTGNGQTMAASLIGAAPAGTEITWTDGRLLLNLPRLAVPTTVKVLLWSGPAEDRNKFDRLKAATPPAENLPALCRGGPPQWKAPMETQGVLGADNAAYVVDTVRLPDTNPWHSTLRPAGLDFFDDGRAAVCSMSGDVWIASGIDSKLDHVTWRRFAAGLYEPLGLKIVSGDVYVLGRDQITRLHDLNGDGEADFYESFFNGAVASPIYHAFAMDLQADSDGNFYYCVDGNLLPPETRLHGCLLKVLKDGSAAETVCTGLRVPNGSGLGPHNELTCSDNQGHWTPACRINLVKKGGFYGYRGDARLFKKGDAERLGLPSTYDPPLCWIPMPVDNSSGGQVFVSGGKWGPLEGQMLHTSYGMSGLYEVMWEDAGGVAQGGVMKFPLKFESGIMRARFNRVDGQLYVCGLKGWQTNAGREGCLQRVRYTGKPARIPCALHVSGAGISITFTDPLDPAVATDVESYGIEQWNYLWSSTYGSPDFKPSNPRQQGRDAMVVKSATLSADHKTVTLAVPGLKPVRQMAIQMHLSAADGTPIECEIDNTINRVTPP